MFQSYYWFTICIRDGQFTTAFANSVTPFKHNDKSNEQGKKTKLPKSWEEFSLSTKYWEVTFPLLSSLSSSTLKILLTWIPAATKVDLMGSSPLGPLVPW